MGISTGELATASDVLLLQPAVGIATNVASGAPPTAAWTDLDVSTVTGARPSVVMLRVKSNANVTREFGFRRNGDTNVYLNPDDPVVNTGIVAAGSASTGAYRVVLVPTSSTGIVEWIVEGPSTWVWAIDVISYWRARE